MTDELVILDGATSTHSESSDLVDLSAAPTEATAIPFVTPVEADIVFLVDVTGSMKPCINALRDNINKFIDVLTSTEGNSSPVTDWRARVVGYRDYNVDGSTSYGWLNDNVFTRDVATLRNQLATLEARGGGDVPESLLDAMMTVATAGTIDLQSTDDEENSNKWRTHGSAARIVIIFTDATYHPTLSIPGYEGAGLIDLYNVYNQERIKPYLFVPSDESYSMLGCFREAILTQYGDGADGLQAVTSDQAKFQALLKELAKGVSESASFQVRVAL